MYLLKWFAPSIKGLIDLFAHSTFLHRVSYCFIMPVKGQNAKYQYSFWRKFKYIFNDSTEDEQNLRAIQAVKKKIIELINLSQLPVSTNYRLPFIYF